MMHDALLHAANEEGFTAADVSSICSMAMSSKSRKLGAFTGEKGIGFKATAVASGVTYISSNGYNFAFNMRSEAYDTPCLGLFCPRWEEDLQERMLGWLAKRLPGTGIGTEVLEGFTTRIWMQLKPDLDKQQLTQELKLLDPYMLLNLRKLKNVTVWIAPGSCVDLAAKLCQLKQLMRVDVDKARVTISVGVVAALCCMTPHAQPTMLLLLAQQSTGKQQVAFFNLLVTLLKLSAASILGGDAGSQRSAVIAASAVDMVLSLGHGSKLGSSAGDAAHVRGLASSSSGNSKHAGSSSSNTSAAPWLMLLGRNCLQLAGKLGQMEAEGADWVQLIRQAQRQPAIEGIPAAVRFYFEVNQPLLLSVQSMISSLNFMLGALKEDISISTDLTAAGYDMGAVLQGVEALASCYPAVLEAEGPGDVAAGSVAGLIKALEAAGRSCSVFAVPHCCNNPGCSLAGAGELSIVSGKGCICGGCKVARYCGKGCQKAHWKQHEAVCKMLQASAQHS